MKRTILLLDATGSWAGRGEGRASKFCSSRGYLCKIDNLEVSLEFEHLVPQGTPMVKYGNKPLGHVQFMDHLAE